MNAAVLFDVDGTLVDTNHLHTLAWVRALRDHGHEIAAWRVHRLIGAGSSVLLRELIGEADDAVKDGWRARFEELTDDIRALPGAADLVRTVRRRGVGAVLATSSPPDLVDHHLRALGLDEDDVDAVTTDGGVDEAKPDPELFTTAMARVGADPAHTVVVGDSVWDVRAANRAGLDAVALRTGGVHEADLTAEGAVAVYDDPADLLARLGGSRLGALLD